MLRIPIVTNHQNSSTNCVVVKPAIHSFQENMMEVRNLLNIHFKRHQKTWFLAYLRGRVDKRFLPMFLDTYSVYQCNVCTCCLKWLILRTLGIPRFGSSNKGIQTKGPYDPPKTPKSSQTTASPNTSPVTNRDSCNRWCNRCIVYLEDLSMTSRLGPLQGTNISHLGKRKIIFKSALGWDMLVPWRVFLLYHLESTSMICEFFLRRRPVWRFSGRFIGRVSSPEHPENASA